MPNLTVSSDVDTFMQSADAAAMLAVLGKFLNGCSYQSSDFTAEVNTLYTAGSGNVTNPSSPSTGDCFFVFAIGGVTVNATNLGTPYSLGAGRGVFLYFDGGNWQGILIGSGLADGGYVISSSLGGSMTILGGQITAWTPAT